MDYNEIIHRLAILRQRNNLSARELSLRIQKNGSYIGKVESKLALLPFPVFLEILEECHTSAEEFFYSNFQQYSIDTDLLHQFRSISPDDKKLILQLLNKIK